MKDQEFKELFQVLEQKEKEAQKVVREVKLSKEDLFKEYLKEQDTHVAGDVLRDHEKYMLLEKKDYSLNLITGLPIIIYYGWACNKKGKRNQKDTRVTIFSYDLQDL